jgi:hypothetical protein
MRREKKLNGGEACTEFHKNGSVCAKGRKLGGVLHGHWEWFRTDGTLKRSGGFDRGVQVGEFRRLAEGAGLVIEFEEA